MFQSDLQAFYNHKTGEYTVAINVLNTFDVHESVHRDTTMKINNKMHYTG
jgi:hypothetical protein